jgi:NAD(P)-dependent dehydrogenase (short-subunit alcohol dehydrogenase family)
VTVKEKTFLITGCTKGIGLAAAKYLNDNGHTVIGIARNSETSFPGRLFQADLSDVHATEVILESIRKEHHVDGIVNNVGSVEPQLLGEINLQSFSNVLDLNLRPAIQATKAFSPKMKENNYGRIVNIASRAALGKIGRSSYSAAKAALIALTRTWALELAPFGITVNAIAPGPIETESFRENYPAGGELENSLVSKIPLNRLGTTEEIAFSIGFLLDERASFITGQTLFVDGGGSIGAS